MSRIICAEGDCQQLSTISLFLPPPPHPSPTQTATTAATTAARCRRPSVYMISATQAFDRIDQIAADADVRWIEGTPSSRRLPTIPNIGSAMVLRSKGAEKRQRRGEGSGIHLILWRQHIISMLIQIGASVEDIGGYRDSRLEIIRGVVQNLGTTLTPIQSENRTYGRWSDPTDRQMPTTTVEDVQELAT
ncbi:hypothetical protein R3P38DRAFT_3295517 [Favolaschia claudopus]|uniref:Uncharacterized protein n=1 Tax=Favolaschia claudopus TaxID=2862362 RepID=A0AAV9ZBH1_9AGAR